MNEKEKIKRWRLILGKESEDKFADTPMDAADNMAMAMDEVLDFVYRDRGRRSKYGGRASRPNISKWMGDLQQLFEKDLVEILQEDAISRYGLWSVLESPAAMEHLESDIELAARILEWGTLVPQQSRESARLYIRRIVDEIKRQLEDKIRAVFGTSIKRYHHSPMPSAAAIDFKKTIAYNLKNYDPERGSIIPEKVFFFEKANQSSKWTIILDIDQSGSMAKSVIYSTVMACILASIPSVKTKVVAFNDEFVDLSDKADDPVELLYGIQMGGGTNINRSLGYCETLIENPEKTLLFLVTDLDEGGSRTAMLRKLQRIKESGVTVISVLAIEDGGAAYYNEEMARKVAGLGIPCFACNPQMLPELLARALKGQDLKQYEKEFQKKK